MVSFSCEVCLEILKKPKLDVHARRCGGAYYSCIDCSQTFTGGSWGSHTSCVTEAEKYQGATYRQAKTAPKAQPQPAENHHKKRKREGEAADPPAAEAAVDKGEAKKTKKVTQASLLGLFDDKKKKKLSMREVLEGLSESGDREKLLEALKVRVRKGRVVVSVAE